MEKRALDNRVRTLSILDPQPQSFVRGAGNQLLNVCSNDYLGLALHPVTQKAATDAIRIYGSGSTASRLIAGTFSIHDQLEVGLASWLGRESALLFNSGFQMNISVIAALADRDTHLYYDRLNHNSLVQGAILSRAHMHRYHHLDYNHLTNLLRENHGKGGRHIIVTESVFSMDGDIADLAQIAAIADQFDALLVVDEAHAIGVCGEEGRGFSYGVDRIDVLLGTFGKAFGSSGAFLACSKALREYMVNFCYGFIYTTAPSPASVGATLGALSLMTDLETARQNLNQTSAWFREQLRALNLDICRSQSHIIPVVIGSEAHTLEVAQRLQEEGFLVQAIRPPTVSPGRSRIRFTLNSWIKPSDLEHLLVILKNTLSSIHDDSKKAMSPDSR